MHWRKRRPLKIKINLPPNATASDVAAAIEAEAARIRAQGLPRCS